MTNQQILTKAIQKAIDGGFTFSLLGQIGDVYAGVDGSGNWCIIKLKDTNDEVWRVPSQVLIFNHDFAKALWGEKPEYGIKRYGNDEGITHQDAGEFIPWQYQLQQMVIAEDPIKYLGENI